MNVNRPRNPFIRLSKFVQITTRAQYTEKKNDNYCVVPQKIEFF